MIPSVPIHALSSSAVPSSEHTSASLRPTSTEPPSTSTTKDAQVDPVLSPFGEALSEAQSAASDLQENSALPDDVMGESLSVPTTSIDNTTDIDLASSDTLVNSLAVSNPLAFHTETGLHSERFSSLGESSNSISENTVFHAVDTSSPDSMVDIEAPVFTDITHTTHTPMPTESLLEIEDTALNTAAVLNDHSVIAPSSTGASSSHLAVASMPQLQPLTSASMDSAASFDVDATLFEGALPLLEPEGEQTLTGRIQWMLGQNLRAADIQLDPPELGPLQIRVSVHQETAQVVFASQNAQVRETLEHFGDRLKEQLAEEGLSLDLSTSSERQAAHHDASDAEPRREGRFEVGLTSGQMDSVSTTVTEALSPIQPETDSFAGREGVLPSLDIFA